MPPRSPWPLAAGAVVAVLALLVGSLALARADPPPDEPPVGAALSATDRLALDAAPVERGGPPPAPDPSVDLTDPEAVARAYLAAAHSVTAEDAGRTHLRAVGYAAPESPPAGVGVVVLDPPPPGTRRTAEVTALALVARDAGDRRRGYRAELGTVGGAAADVAFAVRDVVLARQADGRWLVTADTPANPDLPAGED
jgi:hypothetical protein